MVKTRDLIDSQDVVRYVGKVSALVVTRKILRNQCAVGFVSHNFTCGTWRPSNRMWRHFFDMENNDVHAMYLGIAKSGATKTR